MINVWLLLSFGKVQTLEILRNAIIRFGPKQIKVIYHNLVLKIIELRLNKLTATEISDLDAVISAINGMTSVTHHYGHITTVRANRTIKVVDLKKIKCIWSTSEGTIAIKYDD